MDEQEDDILSETSANVPIEEEEGADEEDNINDDNRSL